MRVYQQLWYLIRDANGGAVKISCAPQLRHRIRKAVYKERDIDMRIDRRRRLETNFLPNGITFRWCGIRTSSGIEILPNKPTKEIDYESFASKINEAREAAASYNSDSGTSSST